MRIVSGAATDTGRVRDGNEDSYLVDRRLKLFAVADGMGGHRAGEVASATALEGLRLAFDSGSAIDDAVGRANSAVWDKASSDTQLAGMGTTLTAAWSDGTTLTVAHVGDSRAYLLRGETLQRVTVDHSLVEELIRDGRLTEEQAGVHPQRSIITRALGIDSSVAVDVYSLVLQANDRVMICSDGLTSMVRASGITEILRRESDPTAAANALVDAANEAGGEDNITVVILDALPDGKDPLPSSVAAAITAPAGATGPRAVSRPSSGDEARAEVMEPAVVSVMTTNTSLDAPAVQRDAEATSTEVGPEAGRVPRDTARYREPKGSRPNLGRRAGRGLGRVLLFAVPILIIVGVAIGTVGWYAQNSYFVAFKGSKVVLYRGRPGGLLFWNPQVERTTSLERCRLTQVQELDVSNKLEFSDRAAANRFIARTQRHPARPDSCSNPTTTTTRPPSTPSTSPIIQPTTSSST